MNELELALEMLLQEKDQEIEMMKSQIDALVSENAHLREMCAWDGIYIER